MSMPGRVWWVRIEVVNQGGDRVDEGFSVGSSLRVSSPPTPPPCRSGQGLPVLQLLGDTFGKSAT